MSLGIGLNCLIFPQYLSERHLHISLQRKTCSQPKGSYFFLIPVLIGPLAITCLPDTWRLWLEARAAVPNPVIEERSLQCDVYVEVIDLLGALGGPATAFCSSYLHTPSVVTVGATVTPEPT